MSAAVGTLLLTNVRIPLSKARSCGEVPVPSVRVAFHRSFATAAAARPLDSAGGTPAPLDPCRDYWQDQHSVRGAASASRTMTSGHAPWGVCAASTGGTSARPFTFCAGRRCELATLPSSPWRHTHTALAPTWPVLQRSDAVMTCPPVKVCAVAVVGDWCRDRGASLNFEDQNF